MPDQAPIVPTVIPTSTTPGQNGSGILPFRSSRTAATPAPTQARTVVPDNQESKVQSSVEPEEIGIEDFDQTTVKPKIEESKINEQEKPEKAAEEKTDSIEFDTDFKDDSKISADDGNNELDKAADEKPDKRDYSGFSVEEIEILKQVRNKSLDAVKKLIKDSATKDQELSKLKAENEKIISGKLPDYYYEHPEAYMLSKEYSETSETKALYDYERTFYTEQLLRIKQGQDFEILKQDDKGNFRKVQIKALVDGKTDHKAELEVQQAIQDRIYRIQQLDAELNQFKGSFVQKHKQTLTKLGEIDKTMFKAFVDETKLPQEVRESLKAGKEFLKKNLPEYENHPLAKMLTQAAASDSWKSNKIKQQAERIKILESKREDSQLHGPTSKSFRGGKPGSGMDKEMSLADFN